MIHLNINNIIKIKFQFSLPHYISFALFLVHENNLGFIIYVNFEIYFFVKMVKETFMNII